jgi:hypothetical protein
MATYLCKWANEGKDLEWEGFKEVDISFFSDSNGYKDRDIFMIKRLKQGDRLDLSDGISQYHEIERLS